MKYELTLKAGSKEMLKIEIFGDVSKDKQNEIWRKIIQIFDEFKS